MRGALLVCGTTSDAGKSWLVAGLCRVLARTGVSVAPFTQRIRCASPGDSATAFGGSEHGELELGRVRVEASVPPGWAISTRRRRLRAGRPPEPRDGWREPPGGYPLSDLPRVAGPSGRCDRQ